MNDQLQMMGQSQILQNHQNYVVWPHLPPFYPPENPAVLARPPPFSNHHPGRVNRKRDRRHRIGSGPGQGFGNPRDSQRKGRRFHHSKRRNHGGARRLAAPFAPRNTTSYIIRSKRAGGIAALVSPYPRTPSILPTPVMTPTREVLSETAKHEWGIDGYGSMKGLIRLRRDSDEESEVISGGSDGAEGTDSEKELDYDVSRFEMLSPDQINLENRVNVKAKYIADLIAENFELRDQIFLVEWELGEMRRRVLRLELETDGSCSEPEVINDGDVCSEKSVGNCRGGGGCV